MNEKDEQAFEKWWEENIDGPNANYVFLKPSKKLFADAWRGACYYMRNRSPLDPVSLYEKLEAENKKLREALQWYADRKNCDNPDFAHVEIDEHGEEIADGGYRAREALKEVGEV